MSTILCVDEKSVQVPDWVRDLKSFRRWAHSDEFPDAGRVCFFLGDVWVDMSREQAFSHNQVKTEYSNVLGPLVKWPRRGRYFSDGMLLTNVAANLSAQPDGIFVSEETFESERIRLVEGNQEGYVELEGSPDMVLEVVSASSVKKDYELLLELYWKAGIKEYWLVDARGERLVFEIYRQTREGYVVTRRKAGWLKSEVFGKSFRLTKQADKRGFPEYTLAVR